MGLFCIFVAVDWMLMQYMYQMTGSSIQAVC